MLNALIFETIDFLIESIQLLFWPFVTSKNERQIAVRKLSQSFAAVRSRSQPFAVVRSRSPMIKPFPEKVAHKDFSRKFFYLKNKNYFNVF
jgi:hypothetical protein